MRKILIILFMLMVCMGISAQSDDDTLIIRDDEFIGYIRLVDGQEEYVGRYGDIEVVYPKPEGCFEFSKDGRYIVSYPLNSNTLKIIHVLSQAIVIEKSFSDIIFETCQMIWLKDNQTIVIFKEPFAEVAYQFYFDGVDITQLPDRIPVDYSHLPNWQPEVIQNQVWQSPNPDIVLYELCVDGEIYTEVASICALDSQLVIYDIQKKEQIAILLVEEDVIRGFKIDPFTGRWEDISAQQVSWSYDGQYLAFCDCWTFTWEDPLGDINIYDLEANRYIEDSSLSFPNTQRHLKWSPNANILAIWKTGPYGDDYESYTYQRNDALNYLVFAYPETGNYVYSQGIFDANSNIIWSPDNRAIAIIGKERLEPREPYDFYEHELVADLILIDTQSGEHVVIDQNVFQLIGWANLCDNPAPQDADICEDN